MRIRFARRRKDPAARGRVAPTRNYTQRNRMVMEPHQTPSCFQLPLALGTASLNGHSARVGSCACPLALRLLIAERRRRLLQTVAQRRRDVCDNVGPIFNILLQIDRPSLRTRAARGVKVVLKVSSRSSRYLPSLGHPQHTLWTSARSAASAYGRMQSTLFDMARSDASTAASSLSRPRPSRADVATI